MKHTNFELKFFLVQPPIVLKTQTGQPGAFSSIDLSGIWKQYSTPEGMLTIGGLIIVVLYLQFAGGGKGKITTGKVCGRSEKLSATGTALKQIRERKHNKVTLWCGSPQYWFTGRKSKGIVARIQTALGSSPTVWLPHAERSILVIGAPGSGKTYSTIDRAIESAMVGSIPLWQIDQFLGECRK